MTNAEAVNWLINITADIGKAEHSDLWHYEQALSEIREMLEDAQPEKRTDKRTETHACDLISRQAAIDAMDTWDWQDLYLPIHFKQLLEELPSAQPQRMKGRWIDVTKTGGAELWKCSECGELELEDSYFCPNCGADMRGDEDE